MFGHINGIAVGEIFEDRKRLRASGIHAPMMAGISVTQRFPYSLNLSEMLGWTKYIRTGHRFYTTRD